MEVDNSSLLINNAEVEIEESCFTRLRNFFFEDDEDDDEDYSAVNPVSFLELFRFASTRERLAMSLAIFLSIIIGLTSPMHIYLSGVLTTLYVDVKEPAGDLEFLHLIWQLSSLYGVLFVFTFAVGYVENWLYVWAAERTAERVRCAFIASILARDAFNEDDASSGELSNRLSCNVDRMKDGIGDNIGTFARSISMFIAGSILSFYLDWKTTLLLIWSGPIALISSVLIPKLSGKTNDKVVSLSEEANGISEEAILNLKTVASCNGERTMIQRFASSVRSAIAPSTRCGFVTALCDASSSLLHSLFHTAGLWYATMSYHEGRIEGAGSVFAVVSLAMDSSSSFTQLGSHLMSVMKARAAAAKVYHTIDSCPADADLVEQAEPATAEMHITFDNVSFSFPDRTQPILHELSFSLSPGESLALVGKSGCGKSTTLKLLTCLLTANSGSVQLDGRSLDKYDKRKWRRCIGVVSQEPALFHGSIRDNICLGRTFSDKEVEKACRMAFAHDFIMGLEEGYSSLLGPSGVSLSGGQKQRIAIARAIVSNPRILLLDEATSALDTKSERIVQEALDAASEGRTTIVVAHRLSTIRNVDRVIVMEEGRVVESGGYEELRSRPNGIFAQMVAAQEIEKSNTAKDDDEDIAEEESEDEQDLMSLRKSQSVDEPAADEFPTTDGGVFSLYFYNKNRAILTTILSLLRGIEMPLLGLSFYFVFSSLKDSEYEHQLFWTMISTFLLGFYSFFIILLSQTVHTYTAESTMSDLRISCLNSLLRRPIAYFDRKETSPAASSVLLSQQPPIAMAIVHNSMSNMIENLFSGCIIAVATFFICIPNGFTGLAYLTIFMVTFAFVEHYNKKAYNSVVEIDKSGELAMEIFDNVATIQQLAVESYFQQRFDEIQKRRRKPLALKIRCLSMVHAINESECMLLDFMATTVGIYFVYKGLISIKELYATEFCISILGLAAVCMSDSFKEIIQASSAARLLFKLIDPTLREDKEEENEDDMIHRGDVHAKSISFAYPSRPQKKTLDDVTFDVREGRSLALVGPSGGGKSTVVNLIERFYQPTKGHIYLDNLNLSTIPAFSLRSAIALVSQEPVLFRGSIIDNVRLGVESASIQDVEDACRAANAHDFISKFPECYSTEVGEKGRSLSGGQKQRIAIARALVRKPKVIVLDEATSALDTQSAQVVREALLSSARDRTSITIAHRLDTIRHCDEICFIEGGKIVERGTHESLMERRSKYAAMVEQQILS